MVGSIFNAELIQPQVHRRRVGLGSRRDSAVLARRETAEVSWHFKCRRNAASLGRPSEAGPTQE
ncbi:MAG: hypothetical protein ACI9VR_002884 [Cognaticolwellia sp.]|jgi:hypothetical protein